MLNLRYHFLMFAKVAKTLVYICGNILRNTKLWLVKKYHVNCDAMFYANQASAEMTSNFFFVHNVKLMMQILGFLIVGTNFTVNEWLERTLSGSTIVVTSRQSLCQNRFVYPNPKSTGNAPCLDQFQHSAHLKSENEGIAQIVNYPSEWLSVGQWASLSSTKLNRKRLFCQCL